MARTKNVRKNILLSANLEKKLLEYCEEYDLSQSQLINIALRSWIDNEDAKKLVRFSSNPKELVQQIMDALKNEVPELAQVENEEEKAG